MNDLKVYHKYPFRINKFACYNSSIYRKGFKVKRGRVHDYLGMYLDFSEKEGVKVSMIKYVSKIIDTFLE